MLLSTTSDTGVVGNVQALSHELTGAGDVFEAHTVGISGELVICLRSLPAELGRRTFTKFYRAENWWLIDLTLTDEEIAGRSLAWQRELLGVRLVDIVETKLPRSKTGWSREEVDGIVLAFRRFLTDIGWLEGARYQAVKLIGSDLSLDLIAARVNLSLGEVEDLWTEHIAT
ncbi:MAG: hypothetical protein K0S37_2850 [Microbacterium sp.]|uniref:hypothetical protein n=1 Tax=Microbacterium sp. MM2322 TaxID=3157631 RepID=UPI003D80078E|nr:hypothetical protein [Microbacterium sp.]